MYIKWDNLYAKSYIFDIDGNLFTKPVAFDVEKWGQVYSFENRSIHDLFDEWYSYVDGDSNKTFWRFRDYTTPDMFLQYVKDALDEKAYGPSFDSFKKAVLQWDLIGVNTARGHSSANIARWIKYIINTAFTDQEKETFLTSLKTTTLKNVLHWTQEETRDYILDTYLSYAKFLAMQHTDFTSMHPDVDFEKLSLKKKKTLWMEDLIEILTANLQELHPTKEVFHSVWFSDDEKPNVEAVCERAESKKEEREKNRIHFVVYDTTELIKHVITDKNITHTDK